MRGTHGPEPSQAVLGRTPARRAALGTGRAGQAAGLHPCLTEGPQGQPTAAQPLPESRGSHIWNPSGLPDGWCAGFPRRANGPPSTGTDGVILTPRSPPLPHPSPTPPSLLLLPLKNGAQGSASCFRVLQGEMDLPGHGREEGLGGG